MHQPTVDEHRGAVDVGAAVTGEKRHHAGDLGRLRHPAERDGGVQDLHLLRVGHRRGVDRGGHRARTDVDDPDALGPELLSRGPGEHSCPALGQAVGGVARHRPVLVHRTDVMIAPPPPCAIICFAASWVPKNALFRFTFSTKSYCASVVSSTPVLVSTPALLTMMSTRPNFFTAASTSVCRSATLLTSASTPIT